MTQGKARREDKSALATQTLILEANLGSSSIGPNRYRGARPDAAVFLLAHNQHGQAHSVQLAADHRAERDDGIRTEEEDGGRSGA